MKYNIENLTIGELTKMGFQVNAYFHNGKNLQDSYKKVKPFTKLSGIRKKSHDGLVWTVVEGDINGEEVSFTAFIE